MLHQPPGQHQRAWIMNCRTTWAVSLLLLVGLTSAAFPGLDRSNQQLPCADMAWYTRRGDVIVHRDHRPFSVSVNVSTYLPGSSVTGWSRSAPFCRLFVYLRACVSLTAYGAPNPTALVN